MDRIRTLLLAAILAVCGASVGAQFWLSVVAGRPEHSVVWRLVEFLSFFTILTNVLLIVVTAFALARPSSPLASPGAMTAAAVYILVVGVTYAWLLAGLEKHQGLSVWTNAGLHQVSPVLFLLYWLVFTPKRGLRFAQALGWLAYPAAYIAYTLARGALTGRYPYPFANAAKLGYPHALLNAVLFLLVFYLLGVGAVAIGRLRVDRPAVETPQASL